MVHAIRSLSSPTVRRWSTYVPRFRVTEPHLSSGVTHRSRISCPYLHRSAVIVCCKNSGIRALSPQPASTKHVPCQMDVHQVHHLEVLTLPECGSSVLPGGWGGCLKSTGSRRLRRHRKRWDTAFPDYAASPLANIGSPCLRWCLHFPSFWRDSPNTASCPSGDAASPLI